MTPPIPVQDPHPGKHLLFFAGDTVRFTLDPGEKARGNAWLRTNVGHGITVRTEIIREVEFGEPPLARDWFDIPMERRADGSFEVVLGLTEVGHFQAKAFFLPQESPDPLWPEGDNSVLNVLPATSVAANSIYNAFVRQFGPNKAGNGTRALEEDPFVDRLDKAGFTVIPPSGTFRDLESHLDFVMGEMGCRIIQLLPVHPTPTTYARMGRFGSPYASLSFTAVDPSLAVFDPAATPMEQFTGLLDAVHRRGGRLLLDMALNHTGWAARLHETHPEWLARGPDGRIEEPGAWGVTWSDLTRLDYGHKDLWRYMARVLLGWCCRGVDGFRCDAGYMIPVRAWRYMVARVRDQFPDTVFFLEGLGGKISVTRSLLNEANFDWAYSELFQNYTRAEIEGYLPGALEISETDGITVHFAETHDNLRLAARSRTFARMRTALTALASVSGAFAFANGVEWFADEKIDVHQARSLSWGSAENQVAEIRFLNRLLAGHPAFFDKTTVKMVQGGPGNSLVILRDHQEDGKKLLCVVNLSDESHEPACWPPDQAGLAPDNLWDILTGEQVRPKKKNNLLRLDLPPGGVLVLTPDKSDLTLREDPEHAFLAEPVRVTRQRLRQLALAAFAVYHPDTGLNHEDPDSLAKRLQENPREFLRDMNPESEESRAVVWTWPEDVRREVMVPPGHFLLVRGPLPFDARITELNRVLAIQKSLAAADGSHFAVFLPQRTPPLHTRRQLAITVFEADQTRREEGPLLYLPLPEAARVRKTLDRRRILARPSLLLGTNGRGAMLRAGVAWGGLSSRYDAILAANLDPDRPEDRRVLFSRCRAWLVYQGFSQEIAAHCLETFCFSYHSRGFWRFTVPSGQGEHVVLVVRLEMAEGENLVRMGFYRESGENRPDRLGDEKSVRLVLRPQIEDRSFHEATKAFMGPETVFPASVKPRTNGFTFHPAPGHGMDMTLSPGGFMAEPQWEYMVYHENEATRGQDPHGDLFSPGWFAADLLGGGHAELVCRAFRDRDPKPEGPGNGPERAYGFPRIPAQPLADAMAQAMDAYVVDREKDQSVIAGYPWFLDWGRDSLIFVRGLIAAGRLDAAKKILTLFGRYEEKGTLPNMIQGRNAGNRDTSDAPLWFCRALADLMEIPGQENLLDEPCGDRTLGDVLTSICENYLAGTPGGVGADKDSALVFSPAHFTWMDTNYPAGTPREGYPVEIQALWISALDLLARTAPEKEGRRWKKAAAKARKSLMDFFWDAERGFLSDCLHAPAGTPAGDAQPDDALRPNQLFTVALGAVTDPAVARKIVEAAEVLLVPGAIRSLADRPVVHALPVRRNGALINDPSRPYWGRYEGDEDARRKPAYHNGTAWTWPFPVFCEALALAFGEAARPAARALLGSATRIINQGALGHVPEILDGDAPHTPRGCDAQAWGASELYRVLALLGESPREGA